MWHLTYWVMPLTFTGLAFFTRLYKIGHSHIVTWDEAQYGDAPSSFVNLTRLTVIASANLRLITSRGSFTSTSTHLLARC